MNTTPTILLLAQATGRNTPGQREAFTVFAVFWVALGLASFLFFHFNRDAAFKRRVFPLFGVAAGLIFGAFLIYMTRGYSQVLFLAVPMIALITFLNIRCTRFCDSCGRTLYKQPVFTRPGFCPHCGAQLP